MTWPSPLTPPVCQARSGSPFCGSSILMTSAPKSASCDDTYRSVLRLLHSELQAALTLSLSPRAGLCTELPKFQPISEQASNLHNNVFIVDPGLMAKKEAGARPASRQSGMCRFNPKPGQETQTQSCQPPSQPHTLSSTPISQRNPLGEGFHAGMRKPVSSRSIWCTSSISHFR